MNDFLDKIRKSVLERVTNIQINPSERLVIKDFCAIFNTSPAIIAEVKLHSPSLGAIYNGCLSALEIATGYIQNGAHALSVLTEPNYFKGNIQTLKDIHQLHPDCPLLLKDFVISTIQIQQAYFAGASAVLLIVAFLSADLLKDLYNYTQSLGLTALIEVHNEEELNIALSLKPKLIGINNRNLKTLKIDTKISKSLIKYVPDDVLVVCESGIRSAEEIKNMHALSFDGFLIGSHFMQSNRPQDALSALLKGVNYAR